MEKTPSKKTMERNGGLVLSISLNQVEVLGQKGSESFKKHINLVLCHRCGYAAVSSGCNVDSSVHKRKEKLS